MIMMNKKYLPLIIILTVILLLNFAPETHAQQGQEFLPDINFEISSPTDDGQGGNDFVLSLRILLILTVLTLAPAIIIMVTSFTRIVIVLSIIRRALAVRSMPPNQVIIGLAIFMTIFIMAPAFNEINTFAIEPYVEEEITQTEALARAALPLKEFMVNQTREKDLLMFMDLGNIDPVAGLDELPIYVVVPAFVISELRIAFQIGFLIYLPFMVIDLVVASILLSMGILFLPPVLVSLPFKILVFVLTDGWFLLVESMIRSFN